MKNRYLKLSAVVAACAVVVPAAAIAKKPEGKGKSQKPAKVKLASVNLKGTVTENDGTAITVTVQKASGKGKACVGEQFTFTTSKVHVADNDLDGENTLADVLVGHEVKVQARVPRGAKGTCTVPQDGVVQAKQVHDRTTPESEDDDDVENDDDADAVAPAA